MKRRIRDEMRERGEESHLGGPILGETVDGPSFGELRVRRSFLDNGRGESESEADERALGRGRAAEVVEEADVHLLEPHSNGGEPRAAAGEVAIWEGKTGTEARIVSHGERREKARALLEVTGC